jgi:hypothetical protein
MNRSLAGGKALKSFLITDAFAQCFGVLSAGLRADERPRDLIAASGTKPVYRMHVAVAPSCDHDTQIAATHWAGSS